MTHKKLPSPGFPRLCFNNWKSSPATVSDSSDISWSGCLKKHVNISHVASFPLPITMRVCYSIRMHVKTVPGASYVMDLVAINWKHFLHILWHKLKAFWMWFAHSPSVAKKRGWNIWKDREREVATITVKLFFFLSAKSMFNRGCFLTWKFTWLKF